MKPLGIGVVVGGFCLLLNRADSGIAWAGSEQLGHVRV